MNEENQNAIRQAMMPKRWGSLRLPQPMRASGNVIFADGTAILKETTSTQIRFDQVFVPGENDRCPGFSPSGIRRESAVQTVSSIRGFPGADERPSGP
jgi:hypothetical protein